MRILMTQRELVNRGGTELFIIEVARELQRRGHQLAVFTSAIGEIAQSLRSVGIWVESDLSKIPWEPEMIHGQHHLQTISAMAYFPNVPAIYYCHGSQPWVEAPPLHSRIGRYVVMCEIMVATVKTTFHLPDEKVTFVGNFFDPVLFARVRDPFSGGKNALFFGNYKLAEIDKLALEKACEEEGYTLKMAGAGYSEMITRPDKSLPDYDVVFAIGRGALEAMACGCAVIPLSVDKVAPLLTEVTFDQYAESNFAPRLHGRDRAIETGWIREQLQKITPESVAAVTQRIRSTRRIEDAVNRIEEIYEESRIAVGNVAALSDARDFSRYLSEMAPTIDKVFSESWSAHEKTRILEIELEKSKVELADKKVLQDELQNANVKIEKLRAQVEDKNVKLAAVDEKLETSRKQLSQLETFLRGRLLGRWLLRRWKKK